MANYLFSPVGSTDISIGEDLKNRYPCLKSDNLRVVGLCLIKLIQRNKIVFDNLKFPIFDAAISYFEDEKIVFDQVFLVASDGPSYNPGHSQDTVNYGKILQEYANSKNYNTKLILTTDIATDFDKQLDNFSEQFDNLPNDFDYEKDTAYVYLISATPAMRNAILFKCMVSFDQTIHLSQPQKRGTVAKQNFPGKFRDEIRKNVAPHALKRAFAIIQAKNLSHTEGSHVMPFFEKNYSDDPIVVLSYSNYLKNTMEFIADSSEGYGNQSFINYEFKDIGNYLTSVLFSKFEDKDKNVESHFLGLGIADGEADAILEIEDKLNSILISLPGGENGKTALVVILKNFFRNLCKHSSTNDNKYIVKLDYDSSYESNEFYKILLSEESKTYDNNVISDSIRNIDAYLSESILTPNFSVRDKGLGIAEMKIAAAYLIGLPLEWFENNAGVTKKNNFPTPFLEVSKEKVKNNSYKLKFIFYLLKPKIAIIEYNNDWNTSNLPQGFDFCDAQNIARKRTRHEFVICNTKVPKLKSSNYKLIPASSENFDDLINSFKKNSLHEKWLANFKKEIPEANKLQLKVLKTNDNINEDLFGNLCCFDKHGDWCQQVCHENPDLIKQLYYYEKYSSLNKPKELIDDNGNILKKSRAMEVVLTNIAILDERVQENAFETKDEHPKTYNLQSLYEAKRIYVPEFLEGDNNENLPFSSWDMKQFKGDKCSLRILMYGNTKSEDNKTRFEFLEKMLYYYFHDLKCHYVILHLSGFETIVNTSYSYLKEKIPNYTKGSVDAAFWYLLGDESLGEHIKNKSQYLVLSSGKGTPKTLPDNSYFVSHSNLESALNKNKYEVVKLLNSLRRIKK